MLGGGLASSIATGGIALVAISTAAVLIQGAMKHKNLDLKSKIVCMLIKVISICLI